MKYKIEGMLHDEKIKVKVDAKNEQEAIEKAKAKYQLTNPRITTTMLNKKVQHEESVYDRAWSRKTNPYVKVDGKGRTVRIFA